jgi:hypothetical protein
MALKATQTVRRNPRSASPHRHCLLNLLLLLWAGTPIETAAGRNLVQESAERHLRAFRDLRNTSAQTLNSHLQTTIHTIFILSPRMLLSFILKTNSCTIKITLF